MIKHGVVMVTLLILTLSLLGVVSASDEITASDVDLSLNHENTQIEVTNDEYVSVSNFKSSDLNDIKSSCDDIEEDIPIYLNSKNVVEIENRALDSLIGADFLLSSNGAGVEGVVFVSDVELFDNGENNISVPIDVASMEIESDLSDDYYKFGHEITVSANEISRFESADGILVIAEVGENEIDNVAVENVLNGINDASNGYVTYRKGNLIKLSSMESGLINIAFFIKKGEFLTMVFYKTGDITPIYSNNVGPQDSVGLWMKLEKFLSDDGAPSSVKSLSNGLSECVLSSGKSVYHDFAALTLEHSMVQTLLEYNLNDDTDLPLDNTGKYIIGVSGDSDDNAFIWYAPDKSAYFGVDSNDNKMIGYNLEDNTFQSRMITVMSYDQTDIKEMVENNLNPDESVMNETFNAAGELTPNDIRQIGVDAGKKALDYFKSQGIDVDKYYQNFYVLTSAGHVKVNGLDTYGPQLIEAIDNLIWSLVATICNVLGMDINGGEAAEMYEIGIGTILGFINGIGSKAQEVWNAGVNIIQGLWDGLKSKVEDIWNWCKDLASSIVSVFTTEFDEHSPSKVFEKIGMNVDMGLANGIANYADAVESSANRTANSAINSMSRAIATIPDLLDDNIDYEPTIRPIMDLSNIQNGASAIGSMMSGYSITGRYNLPRNNSVNVDVPVSAGSRPVANITLNAKTINRAEVDYLMNRANNVLLESAISFKG